MKKVLHLIIANCFVLTICVSNLHADWYIDQINSTLSIIKKLQTLDNEMLEYYMDWEPKDEREGLVLEELSEQITGYLERLAMVDSTSDLKLLMDTVISNSSKLLSAERSDTEIIATYYTMILALNSWRLMYQAFLGMDMVTVVMEKNINNNAYKEGNVIQNFFVLSDSLESAWEESIMIIDSSYGSNMLKGLYRGATLIGLLNKDFWVLDIKPSTAIKAVVPFDNLSLSVFPDEWDLMLREYVEMQNLFYHQKKIMARELQKLNMIAISKGINSPIFKFIDKAKDNSIKNDLLFKKIDTLSRFHIMDVPMVNLGFYRYLQFVAAKHWLDDDYKIEKAVSDFCKEVVFVHMVSHELKSLTVNWRRQFKSSLGEKRYKEVIALARTNSPFYHLMPLLTEPQPK
jgi:hypothetical protein